VSSDRDLIIDTTTRVAWYADQRRWDDIPGLFAEKVILDYTSLTGGEPATVTPTDIAASWQASLGGLDATQHLVSNHLVELAQDGASAIATAQFLATHLLANQQGGPTWSLGGHYHWTLRRVNDAWKIESMTMTATWASGNQQIMALAADRHSGR
jgi:hypothetical protein